MKDIVFCERCKLEINKGDKVACMNTYNEFPNVSDERYFHFDCFLEWKNQKITEAGKKAGDKAMKKVIPMIKPMIQNITNSLTNNEEETNKSDLQEYRIG